MKNPSALHTLLTQSFEAERSLRQFASLASQELITLLVSASEDLNSETQLDSAKSALERAIFLSRNLRYFSTGARSDFSLTDLSQLVFDCLHSKEKDFQKKNISLNVQVESTVFGLVDALAVEQALLNLFDFASNHATPNSELDLSLQVVSQGLQFTLTFEDAPNSDSSASLPFQPVALENIEGQNLYRLGLHVSSAIAKWHSGTFYCFKSLSEGTQFLIEFPFDSRMNKPHLFREKRRFQRVKVDFPAEVQLSGGNRLKGKVTVLSTGGAFFASSHTGLEGIRTDEKLSLQIQTDTDHTLSISVARVANTQVSGENSGLGLEFIELDAKAKNLLAALVKAHAS